MSDHTRAARLAATALDFDLTPGERVELDLHRAECVRCRQIDDDFRADAAVLHRLPRLDAPSQLRQAVAEAAWQEEVPHRNRTGLILLVAAILMLAMAVGGGIAASQWLQRDDDATQPIPTFGPLPADLPLPEGRVSLLVAPAHGGRQGARDSAACGVTLPAHPGRRAHAVDEERVRLRDASGS